MIEGAVEDSESSRKVPPGDMLSPSAANAATPSESLFRLDRRILVAVGVDGVRASKPSDLRRISMSRAMSTVSSPDLVVRRMSVLREDMRGEDGGVRWKRWKILRS